MNVTRGANFAFHALARLASLPDGDVQSVEELARDLGASPTYMAKLMQRLAHAGIVQSRRGTGGGYALVLPAHQISLSDVIAALEGDLDWERISLPSCTECPLREGCMIERAVQKVHEEAMLRLQNIKVSVVAKTILRANGRVQAGAIDSEPNSQ